MVKTVEWRESTTTSMEEGAESRQEVISVNTLEVKKEWVAGQGGHVGNADKRKFSRIFLKVQIFIWIIINP